MGIAPYKYFTYDGESSRDYDVYLTGTGVFNAPERAVEMVEIPGRNGNYALDKGKFNNISVTYKAGIVDYSESDFADKVSAVRNWLCSKVGYKRLSDDYNPNEYRMAVFKSGVNIEHEDLRTGTFDIVFECKPQRWLTSGETATAVANNGTLSNPTPFDSEPLLAVKGYGTIGFNGYEIEIENGALGTILMASESSISSSTSTITLNNVSSLNASDPIYFSGDSVKIEFIVRDPSGDYMWTSASVSSSSNVVYAGFQKIGMTRATISVTCDTSTQFAKGTSSTITSTAVFSVNGHGVGTLTLSASISFAYDGDDEIVITRSVTASGTYSHVGDIEVAYSTDNSPEVCGDSSKTLLGNPTYIDCEVGECYKYEGAEIVSLNDKIALGSDLPKLSVGTNTFTYDNTVTELKVTPRWWKV